MLYTYFSAVSLNNLQVVAKFGMMHLVATNVCIVIRTLVKESAKEFIHGKPNSLEDQIARVSQERYFFRKSIFE